MCGTLQITRWQIDREEPIKEQAWLHCCFNQAEHAGLVQLGAVGEVGGGDVMAAGLAEEALRVRPGLVWRKRGGEFLRALYLRASWVGGQLGGRGRGELGSRWNNSL